MTTYRESSVEEITRRAYGLYLERGGDHGNDVQDWVQAEKELSGDSVARLAISFLSLVKNEGVQPRFQGPPEQRTESFCKVPSCSWGITHRGIKQRFLKP